jgi:hypothetical protein
MKNRELGIVEESAPYETDEKPTRNVTVRGVGMWEHKPLGIVLPPLLGGGGDFG